ncbi:ribonuclease H protein [Pyrus ussuriensis x Pyrus communis]|uniref:Ribonuclease H protein n=1 Tax=Pyrus ussuriensis x Pyrus communis TaxID=2448454 RepID=A0A5N5GWF9_9ROSA|nr:ribonuclease H protein [Pyrus ussuriensis x Pyrus communis]
MKGFLWEGVEEGKKNHLVKWEIVIKSKEEGGLGVGNLRNQNEALLAKWLWRFPKEPNSLWHKVIRSKYGLQDNGWNANPPLRGSSRSPWKDISCGLQSFLQCCKFEVSNGERVRCWEDGWLEGGPLKEQFPRLFLLSRMHNQNITSFVDLSINSLSWNFDFRRNLNEVEIEGAARLLQKVENIWKSKVPLKVKVLVWLVAIGKLNTCDQIQRRSPFICFSPHWCSLCKAKEESVNHIFLHCSYTIQLWKAKALWGCLVSAVFWNIWLERNKRIFEDYTVRYWASFWASVSNDFKNLSLSHILWDRAGHGPGRAQF